VTITAPAVKPATMETTTAVKSATSTATIMGEDRF
jgi:hypothetical protein